MGERRKLGCEEKIGGERGGERRVRERTVGDWCVYEEELDGAREGGSSSPTGKGARS